MKASYFLSLNAQDFLKGLLLAVATGVFAMMARSIENQTFTFNFTEIWHTAVAAAVTYIVGKYLSGPDKVKAAQ